MNSIEEQLKKQAAAMRLTDEEKGSMRLFLNQHIRHNPLGAVRSNWLTWMRVSRVAAPAFAAVLLCAGTSYAAARSLPGDLLYPLKIHVNERIEVALAPTPAAKAQTEATLAAQRVAEAQTLAARGDLDATTTQELQDSFDASARAALAYAHVAEPSDVSVVSTTTTVVAPTPTSSPTFAVMATHRAAIKVSVATTTDETASTTSGAAEEHGFIAHLKTSLDIQAGILQHLKLNIELQHSSGDQGHEPQSFSGDSTVDSSIWHYGDNVKGVNSESSTSSSVETATSTPSMHLENQSSVTGSDSQDGTLRLDHSNLQHINSTSSVDSSHSAVPSFLYNIFH